MSRELKFRVWDKQNKKWFDPYKDSDDGAGITLNGQISFCSQSSFGYVEYPDRFIIQQFTGFLDKNHKEIYEGDKIRDSEGIKIIGWINGGWHVGYSSAYSELARCPQENIEVIGNIYEN